MHTSGREKEGRKEIRNERRREGTKEEMEEGKKVLAM